MNRESDNMGFVPYNFDPEYLIEEINSREHLEHNRSPFLYDSSHFLER